MKTVFAFCISEKSQRSTQWLKMEDEVMASSQPKNTNLSIVSKSVTWNLRAAIFSSVSSAMVQGFPVNSFT